MPTAGSHVRRLARLTRGGAAVIRKIVTSHPALERLIVRAAATALPWEVWERNGFHLTPNTFYSPVPNLSALPAGLWDRRSAMVGVDLRVDVQLDLMRQLADGFSSEYNALPVAGDGTGRFHLHNGNFESLDAQVFYALVRHHRPRRIVEVGSGWSTLVALEALHRNAAEGHPGTLVACEPYPRDFLQAAAAKDDLLTLLPMPVQDVPLDVFTQLNRADMCFIDSSHVCATGSDVTHELLEIVPRLAPGVLIHFHDILLPAEYPRSWVMEDHLFWNEAYALQAFLAFNHEFRVVWASALLVDQHPDRLSDCFQPFEPDRGHGSFWLERTGT